MCKTTKDDNRRPADLLLSLPIPDRPWVSVRMDFIGPLPRLGYNSKEYDYLMVIIDLFSSQVHLVPMTVIITTKGIAWLYLKEVVHLHGLPDSIVSNRDTKFTAMFWCELQ